MPSDTVNNQFEILVDGQKLSPEVELKIQRILVESCLGMPGMFHLMFDDEKISLCDAATFDIGKEVEIKLPSNGTPKPVIKGLITSIEPEYDANSTVILHVRGYDKSIKLTQGKKTRAFLKMKDSDIVKKIAGENGLSVTADDTTVTFDQVNQVNQTDWDFIITRARLNGYWIGFKENSFLFKKIKKTGGSPELNYGTSLREFRPRLSALGHYTDATVSGWNTKEKKEITSKISSSTPDIFTSIGANYSGPSIVKKIVSNSEEYSSGKNIFNESEAKTIAEAQMLESEGRTVQAEGTVNGDSAIIAGTWVKINGVGTKFSGNYLVTQARHILSHGSYTTWFSTHGAIPQTLVGLVSSPAGVTESTDRIFGVVPAIVTNNEDKDGGGGRVKLKFPWLPGTGKDKESDWARITSFFAGSERGAYYLPEVNDEVLVAFEQGDLNRPYVIGSLWNGKDKLPAPIGDVVKGGKVCQRIIKTSSGHKILLEDESGKEKITIIDKTGENSIIIDSAKNSITLNSKQEVIINSKKDITFDAQGNVNIKCKGSYGVDAVQAVTVKSNQSIAIQDAANNKLELGPASATLSGTMASVKGSAMTEISGGMVKIN